MQSKENRRRYGHSDDGIGIRLSLLYIGGKGITMKKFITLLLCVLMAATLFACREADRVSHNISQEADSFNITRQLTCMNVRTDSVLFTMTGNFSITKESDGDLAITGENPDGTYYKHFVYLSDGWITYVVEDISGGTSVSKYQYEINFNPKLMFTFTPDYVD